MNETPRTSTDYGVFTTGISCNNRRDANVPLTLGKLSEMSAGGWLDDLVSRIAVDDVTPRIWLFIDEPNQPLSRIMAALAAARKLAADGHSVVVLDGDDQKAHLSTWAGCLQGEGWIDIVRYGMSLAATGQRLPFGDGRARMLPVGSYKPTRLETEEAAALAVTLTADAEFVLIAASSGDRGLIWSGLDSYNFLCRRQNDIGSKQTRDLIRDLQAINLPPHDLIIFEGDTENPTAIFDKHEFRTGRSSSLIFRIAAILMAVLLGVLVTWLLSLWLGEDDTQSTLPQQPVGDTVVETPIDTLAPVQTKGDTTIVDPGLAGETAQAERVIEPEIETVTESEDPFTLPVGRDGYCLHVFSLADSLLAEQQLDEMAALGVKGYMHAALVDGRIWYRIYTGSFASVAQSRAAMPEIFERLEIDWAMPASSRRIQQP